MKSSTKKILILVIAIAVIACASMLLLKPENNASEVGNQAQTQETNKPEEIPNPEYVEEEDPTKNDENINGLDKPIFMYFVTNADLKNKETAEVLEKLQKEYKDTVIFEIRNADEDKTLYDNFPIDDNMPMLIMQKKGGDISNFLFKTNDYDSLKSAIDATL